MVIRQPQRRRRSIRIPSYDYSSPGSYFVTVCTKNRLCLFGKVVGGEMTMSRYGSIVMDCWQRRARGSPRWCRWEMSSPYRRYRKTEHRGRWGGCRGPYRRICRPLRRLLQWGIDPVFRQFAAESSLVTAVICCSFGHPKNRSTKHPATEMPQPSRTDG